ncbi:hypothetical protein [Jannaschia marina]|uniref:hypothetical protein n=1 Tax=Jannaschia marina TaxID=2741674 RepID=UPI0015C8EE8A|nr:hypothetical protein [Jannaschia marina]
MTRTGSIATLLAAALGLYVFYVDSRAGHGSEFCDQLFFDTLGTCHYLWWSILVEMPLYLAILYSAVAGAAAVAMRLVRRPPDGALRVWILRGGVVAVGAPLTGLAIALGNGALAPTGALCSEPASVAPYCAVDAGSYLVLLAGLLGVAAFLPLPRGRRHSMP